MASGAGDSSIPAKHWAAVTTSDSANLTYTSRALYVGTGGDVVLVGDDGVSATFKNVPSGAVLAVRAVQVKATSTTATDIVALY